MTQESGNQFDNDLAAAEKGYSSSGDLMDAVGGGADDDSPIAKLKSIVLSIDWEITDKNLFDLEEELIDLADIWQGDKIRQIYIQGLSKIGKYIQKEKASSHPDAIKLLISFYHNLEKIVSDQAISDEEKKSILLADVKKFDTLKAQIGQKESVAAVSSQPIHVETPGKLDQQQALQELKTLKAQVLGIDWEINDKELRKLGDEVSRLESLYSHDKAKLILLQGIGALSSYINKMRSQANSEVFSLLHSFYGSLEKITAGGLPSEEEKKLLLEEVGRFNEFKESVARVSEESGDAALNKSEAASDLPDSMYDDDDTVAEAVNSQLSNVFGEVDDGSVEIDADDALAGVNVETAADDDSEEDALPYEDGTIAPALSEVESEPSFSVEKLADDLAVAAAVAKSERILDYDSIETDEDEGDFSFLDGVDVETEADDDSDEDALPTEAGDLAPALAGEDDESGFDYESIDDAELDFDTIENRLGTYFDDDSTEEKIEQPLTTADINDDTESAYLDLMDMEKAADADDTNEESLSLAEDDVAPALSVNDYDGDDEILVVQEELSFAEDDVEPDDSAVEIEDKKDELVAAGDVGAELHTDGEETAFEEGKISTEIDEVDSDSIESRLGEFFGDVETLPEEPQPLPVKMEDTTEEQEILTESPADDLYEEIAEAASAEYEEDELLLLEDDTDEHADTEDGALSLSGHEFGDASGLEKSSFGSGAVGGSDDIVGGFMEAEDSPRSNDLSEDGIDFANIDFVPSDKEEDEDVIEFSLPAEAIAAAGSAVAGAAAAGDVSDGEEIVFEAVADDVALDPLPDEQKEEIQPLNFFDDSSEKDKQSDNGIVSTRYNKLKNLCSTIDAGEVDVDRGAIFREINALRSRSGGDIVEKLFLQLLSSACQNIRNDSNKEKYISLVNNLIPGLVLNESKGDFTREVQESLLSCTCQLLQLQQRTVNVLTASSAVEKEQPDELSDKDQIINYIQRELADTRNLFLKEFDLLRQEISRG